MTPIASGRVYFWNLVQNLHVLFCEYLLTWYSTYMVFFLVF